ncbi:MAG: Transcriptional regulator [Rhodobacteraceae bacterium HLUCCA12]|nr:MAG: Transcriptional regulator [Rhodobacteraceae bacterium HLUCCA12]
MNLRQLVTFVRIVEEGSFNKAAQRLHATQSGLSMQIRNLEEDLGVALLERSARGVTPTRAGRLFYRRAAAILHDVDQARSEMRQIDRDVAGPLRVGLMPTFTRGLLAPVIQGFLRDYPSVELSVTEAYSALLTDMVLAEETDFAIVPTVTPPDGVSATHLGTDPEMLLIRPGGSVPHLAPIRLADLGPLKLVLAARGNARRDAIEAALIQQGLPIETIIDMDAMIATLEFVAQSDFITILPATVAAKDIPGTERWVHPLADPPLTVSYSVIQPAARALSPAASLFLERLRKEYTASQDRWSDLIGAPRRDLHGQV